MKARSTILLPILLTILDFSVIAFIWNIAVSLSRWNEQIFNLMKQNNPCSKLPSNHCYQQISNNPPFADLTTFNETSIPFGLGTLLPWDSKSISSQWKTTIANSFIFHFG